jgi:ubiquitin
MMGEENKISKSAIIKRLIKENSDLKQAEANVQIEIKQYKNELKLREKFLEDLVIQIFVNLLQLSTLSNRTQHHEYYLEITRIFGL